MERMQYNSFYMGSDMSYLIQKPAAVAAALRQHIASLLETTVNAA
jgi:hypothetical protein